MKGLAESLSEGDPLVLDGAIGTELAARGFSTDRVGWSSAATWEAPDLLCAIYRDYVEAGADIITANTFRAHHAALAKAGRADQCEVVRESVELARQVGPRFVVGSIGPLADCYSPELVPDNTTLATEHAALADALAGAGVDGVILETMNTYREAAVALQAVLSAGLTAVVSLWAANGETMGDGVSIVEAARKLVDSGANAVCVNCLPADEIAALIEQLKCVVPVFGAYANTGKRVEERWEITSAADPIVYAEIAARWINAGACLVGGCCMTAPAHIREIRNRVDAMAFGQPRA